MTIGFLFAWLFLSTLLMAQDVKLLDPYARRVSVANLRGAEVKGSYQLWWSS